MRAILILLPYLLIPLFAHYLLRKGILRTYSSTYYVSIVLVFFYPFLFFWVDNQITPPVGPRCGMPEVGFFFGNLFFMLPITLGIQGIINNYLHKSTS
jgi:hypothetical protein